MIGFMGDVASKAAWDKHHANIRAAYDVKVDGLKAMLQQSRLAEDRGADRIRRLEKELEAARLFEAYQAGLIQGLKGLLDGK
jgi:hypothetical protein